MKFWFLEPFYGSLPCYRPRILVQVRHSSTIDMHTYHVLLSFLQLSSAPQVNSRISRQSKLDSKIRQQICQLCVRVQKVILFSRFNYFGVFALIVYKWQEGRLICIMHYVPDMSSYNAEYLGVGWVGSIFYPLKLCRSEPRTTVGSQGGYLPQTTEAAI